MDELNKLYEFIESLVKAGKLSEVEGKKLDKLAYKVYEEGNQQGWANAEESAFEDNR